MYSLISILIKAFLSLNIILVRPFAVSVFHTQVGPRNRKLPRGLDSSFNHALALLIAFDTAIIALSCHTTCFFK
ncbi:hypothetical protein HOG21_06775 [bacterium]|nr:hypothetical protein [bacterium]